MSQEQLPRLIDSAPDEDGYRRSTSPLQFNGEPIQRNKARLMTGEIVEYDEAIEVDPENPGIPSPAGENCQPKYLGIGEIIEVRGSRQSEDGRLMHLWEYGLPSPVMMPTLYNHDLLLDFSITDKIFKILSLDC